jgi:hypothetical protein
MFGMTQEMPIFILGFHRGGTTLFQRLLNCFDHLVIFGEHKGFLEGFRVAYQNIRNSPIEKIAFEKNSRYKNLFTHGFCAWYNNFNGDDFLISQRSAILQLFAIHGGLRWGFKEIRYNNYSMMVYLKKLFPRSKMIFINRDPREIFLSRILVSWSDIDGFDSHKLIRKAQLFRREYLSALSSALRFSDDRDAMRLINYKDIPHAFKEKSELMLFLELELTPNIAHRLEESIGQKIGSSFKEFRKPNYTADDVERLTTWVYSQDFGEVL